MFFWGGGSSSLPEESKSNPRVEILLVFKGKQLTQIENRMDALTCIRDFVGELTMDDLLVLSRERPRVLGTNLGIPLKETIGDGL